ncbi:hypothetical protein WB401_04495 [Streptomyces brasiliscabiei]|uniref:Secreted protein n=1 Tax=Streptomyces brasiliscabiei TaxID=2736302 RepID=A0ABU8GQD8_9ACTN
MFFTHRLPNSRAIRIGLGTGLAGLAALGTVVAGSGTASAASQWKIQFVNDSIPSGTGSIQIRYGSSIGSTSCDEVRLDTGTVTATNATLIAGQWAFVTPYANKDCTGSTTGGEVDYNVAADTDKTQKGGLNCDNIRLRVDSVSYQFSNCQ